MFTLYPDQEIVIDELREALRRGCKRPLLVAPCGYGKGSLISWMIQGATSRGLRSVFLVNRRALVKDLSRRLDRLGLDHGIIMANSGRNRPWLPVQVASIDTLRNLNVIPKFDLAFADEAHFCTSDKWEKAFAAFGNIPVIGFTATPIGPNGQGLGDIFTTMVEGPSTAAMVESGRLVHTRVFAPSSPDTSHVDIVNGEFDQGQLSQACDDSALIGDMVRTWKSSCPDRSTVGFAVDIKHAEHCCQKFREAGVNAVVVHSKIAGDPEDVWKEFDAGHIQMVWSVDMISYGWDHPIASAGIDARPTWSLRLYLQKVGRLSRVYPGKPDSIWLDHAGNVMRHGLPDADREWSLESKKLNKKDREYLPPVRQCRSCMGIFSARLDVCPHVLPPDDIPCRAPYIIEGREIKEEAGELKEVERPVVCNNCRRGWAGAKAGESCQYCRIGFMKLPYIVKELSKNSKIAEIQREAQQKGYSAGWVWHRIQTLRGRGARVA